MTAADVLLLAGKGRSTRVLFDALDEDPGLEGAILEDAEPYPRFLGRRVHNLGMARVAGQLLFLAVLAPVVSRASQDRIREILDEAGLDDPPIPDDRAMRVRSANDPTTADLLEDRDPDVVVVNGTRILDVEVLEVVDAPVLNVHAGITPTYRGVHGGYWALRSDEPKRFGVTIHLVDPGIDTGDVVAQATAEPTSRDTYATYPFLQLSAGIPLLRRAIRNAASGDLTASAPDGPSNLWTHPTAWEYLEGAVADGVW